MATAPATFEDWKDLFYQWQKDIQFNTELLGDFEFKLKYDEKEGPVILFGDYKGQPKWDTVDDIPEQGIRDLLLKLIIVQGDTEFASVEQQRRLLDTAPSDYDLKGGVRYLAEEMRHGWQMCHVLIEHFGDRGQEEAAKMFARNADEGDRILNSFNEPIDNWLEFFMFRGYIDRDGKHQLTMQSHCAFTPYARSMRPMLIEEAFHYGSGHSGMRRALMAEKLPLDLFQRYMNKWISSAYDLFGKDESKGAAAAYRYSLKSRVDELEHDGAAPEDLLDLNDYARHRYREEVVKVTDELNAVLRRYTSQTQRLTVPDIKFNRHIGRHAGEHYTTEGDPISEEAWEDHRVEALPTEEDHELLHELLAEDDWIAPKRAR